MQSKRRAQRTKNPMAAAYSAKLKTPFLFIFTILVAAQAITQESSPPQDTTKGSFAEVYNNLQSIPARLEGSPAEKKALSLIIQYLESNGIPYIVSDLGQVMGAHSYSSSIEISLPGTSTDEVVLVAPLNSRETSEVNGAGAVNIALALEIARAFSRQESKLSLRILINGAEFGDGEAYPIGSRAFVSSYFPKRNVAVLYLDFEKPPERIAIRAGDRGFVAPYWLLERCITGLDSAQLPFRIRSNENQFYRLGVAANPAPLGTYLESGYPAVSLHSANGSLPESALQDFADSFASFMGSLLSHEEDPTRWDRHYLFFQIGDLSVVIGELVYIIILLSIVVLLILYPIFLSARFRSYILSLIHNLWALPMLLVLMFFLLLVGTFLIEGLSSLRGYPDYWMRRPAEFFILKLITAVFLFSLLSHYLRKIPFPKRGRFYSAAALLILIADVFLLSIVDISLAYYVLWACVWAFLFSLTPNRKLKGLCFLISPVWLILAAYDMLTIPALEIAEQMIVTRTSGNLLVAFILFPFLLMLIRLDFMFRHPRRKTKRLLLTVTYIVLGLGCGGLVAYLVLTEPFSAAEPQPVVLRETQHLAKSLSSLELTSPASLGELTVETPWETVPISTKAKVFTIETPLKKDLVEMETEVSRFLGRATYLLKIASKGLPSSVEVSLRSDSEIIVYDSSFPLSFESANAVKIHIGRYPPNPLAVEFTVPGELNGTVEVRVGYTEPPEKYRVTGTHIETEQRLKVITRATYGQEF